MVKDDIMEGTEQNAATIPLIAAVLDKKGGGAYYYEK
jgi:hypothetical protein